VPKLSRVAYLGETVTGDAIPSEERARSVQRAADSARSLGLELHWFQAARSENFPALFGDMIKKGDRGLVVLSSPFMNVHRQQIADLAVTHRIPAIYPFKFFVEAGGLISYGTKNPAAWRRTAAFVDKILRGAKPGDLPVEQSTEFELVINMKTAKALGLTIPQSILLRADQIIE
jgi:putative ABC transport system substrate-binding protein